ncbi:hypothetical protein KVR01_004478 [Diaporthe batatas]|uniref:uncharacterized protein n=1 Tax=Diaporthe batatas TaxID=748121 RepID=UPI001D054227|nr:uncharacterized protein KVR01_004478 [Diaporthe batatas]KAG8165926.1 hypothetical protein KVR01_004478 [Diaporthe batatas]
MAGLMDIDLDRVALTMADPMDMNVGGVEFMRMESPADPELSFHLFPSLPYELRLEIIEEWFRSRGDVYWTPGNLNVTWSGAWIYNARSAGSARSRRRNPLAEYATIDKQWKLAIEKLTFLSLSFVIPELGRSALLDDGESCYRSNAMQGYDSPDVLDDFERICVRERINAVMNLSLSINPHNSGPFPTVTALNTMFPAGGHGDNPDLSVVQAKAVARAAFMKVLKVLERFRESRLKRFSLDSGPAGLRMADPVSPADHSLHLGQSLYALTCRVEVLSLWHVVDLPYFLKQSWAAKKEPSRGAPVPAWPSLRNLSLSNYVNVETPDCDREAAELYESVTHALPQIPKLSELDLSLDVPRFLDTERLHLLQSTRVYIDIPPRNGRSATRGGRLSIHGPAPDQATIDGWLQIARRQWDCNLWIF